MIIGIDANILVHYYHQESVYHALVRKFVENELIQKGHSLGISPHILLEYVHVITDQKRFSKPLSMHQALKDCERLNSTQETTILLPTEQVLKRTMELLEFYKLGRKRILDTFLAAILESSQVTHLLTFDQKDFSIFPFLQIIVPHETW